MPMPVTRQASFFDPDFVYRECLEPGTLPWLLARHIGLVCPPWLVQQWERRGLPGRNPWPATVLLSFQLMRFRGEGMSRREAVARAANDAQWRAALRLKWTDPTPGTRVMGRFERFLRCRDPVTGVPRYLLLFEHIGRVCLDAGVLRERPVWAVDSTYMHCFGAVLDTVRQLGDGVRALAGEWARVSGIPMARLAIEWDCSLLLAKSTKGWLSINWADASARADAIDRLARLAIDTATRVRRGVEDVRNNKRKGLLRRARNLLRVVAQDLETDEHGRLVVARRVVKERLISLTDPEARHGRKSNDRKFNGFKLHVLGDVVSGFIAAVGVTQGNEHDSGPACRLIMRAQELVGDIERLLGDSAYGAARLRHVAAAVSGVEIVAPPPKGGAPKPGRFGKRDFTVDLAADAVTCPNGVTVNHSSWLRAKDFEVRVPSYSWPISTCGGCALRERCIGDSKRGRQLALHPYEHAMRAAREQWERPEVQAEYRVRGQCERLVNQVTRHGGRQARTWGLGPAQLQAHTIAMRCNLDLLAARLAMTSGA